MVNGATSYTRGTPVGPDPWGGSTLEWFTLSPPPVHNFDLVPDVRSAEPLTDIRDAIRRRNTRWTPPPARLPEAAPARSSEGEGGVAVAEEPGSGAESGESEEDPGEASPQDENDRPVA